MGLFFDKMKSLKILCGYEVPSKVYLILIVLFFKMISKFKAFGAKGYVIVTNLHCIFIALASDYIVKNEIFRIFRILEKS